MSLPIIYVGRLFYQVMGMQKIILSVFVLLFGLLFDASAIAQMETVRSRYNEAIDKIVNEIKEVKSDYPEIESFSESAVKVSEDGFKTVYYERQPSPDSISESDPYAYRFSISARPINDMTQDETKFQWKVGFPLLGIMVVMNAERIGEWASFDLHKIVENKLDGLRDLEQEFLPFRLELATEKQTYVVSEEIMLTITLRNMGSKPYKVADLDENGLYCIIGDLKWGIPNSNVELNRVLNGNATFQKMLRINGPQTPQEMNIVCTYALGYRGVQPYNRIRVPIQPKS